MSDYFILFSTADNCGHCQQARGDGILNDGKVLNSSNFLKKLLKFNMQVVNVHYYQMVATKSNIKDVSIMYLKDGAIIQEKYSPFKNETRLEVYQEMLKDTKKIYNDFVTNNKQKVEWKKFINERISNKITNYLFYFPCFMIIKRKNWADTIKDPNEELMALTNAGFTIENEKGSLGLLKTSASINGRNVDIMKLIEGIDNGTIPFEPSESNKVPEEKPKNLPPKSIIKKDKKLKKDKKEKKVRIGDFIEYQDVVVRAYDE
jgi:hypothetical protein